MSMPYVGRTSLAPLISAMLFGSFLSGEALRAQTFNQETQPLRFARAGSRARRRFKDDWEEMEHEGIEWAYCVRQWSTALTQDKDTVYIIESVERITGVDAQHNKIDAASSPQCYVDSQALPIAHTHPSGDCSPSRGDMLVADFRGAKFELIVCGPESTLGYFGRKQ